VSRTTQDTAINNDLYVYGLSPSLACLSKSSNSLKSSNIVVLQPHNCRNKHMVWANPRSLATTNGITIVFSSSGYLDVSVHRVCSSCEVTCLQHAGLPHSEIYGSIQVCANPRSLSQLITSFIASESLGIRHTPLFSLLYFLLWYK
jgi:hypothetical protein